MYGGRIVEMGDVHTDLRGAAEPVHDRADGESAARHGRRGLAAPDPGSAAQPDQPPARLLVPSALLYLQGRAICREAVLDLRPIEETAHLSRCHFAEELIGRVSKLHETVEQP